MSAREPLLLIHGFVDSARTWDPLVGLLEPHHEVVAPSLLGHRGGPSVPEELTEGATRAMVDDLERVLDEAGHETAHLVGNSLGGWLALELAARGRARTVTALSPGHGWEGDAAPRSVVMVFRSTRWLAPIGGRIAHKLAVRPRLRKIALNNFIAHPERVPPATAYELIRAGGECDIFDLYTEDVFAGAHRWDLEVDVPVRIAWGRKDRTLPFKTCSPHFRELLPDAEWVELPDCGHLPQHDDPQLVARTILEVTQRSVVPA